MIEVKNLFFAYDKDFKILNGINFKAGKGSLIAVLGPNGAGKTTLFRCMLGFLKPQSGTVEIDGKNIIDYSRRDLASKLAYIPQTYNPVFNHTVLDTVLMGTTRTLGLFEQPGKEQIEDALFYLNELGILHLKDRGSLKISGGERNLMLIARALVQKAKIIIMDEPASNLDYGNSYRIMQKISHLRDEGYTILFSGHNPDQAIRWADRVFALYSGSVLSDGSVEKVLTEDILKTLYGVNVALNTVVAGKTEYRVCIPWGHIE